MRIPSGVTDQYIYFVAVDSTDFTTRETGLSSFTVYRSRNGAAAAAMTTPTINETDSTNMPGVYELLLDEDMTIGSGNDSEEMCFHITHAGMAPVTRTIELYRPKITAGNTLGVEADGDVTKVNTLDGHTAQTGDSFARIGAPAGASIAADLVTIDNFVDDLESRLTAARAGYLDALSGITSLAEWLGLIAGKQTGNATARTEIRATGAGSGTFDETTDSLEAVRDTAPLGTAMRGTDGANTTTPPTAAAVADAVLDEDLSGHTTAGSLGKAVADIETDVTAIKATTDSIGIKKNAAFSDLQVLMVDETDGKTPETGLTVTGQRSIDGGAFANIAGTITEVSNGLYQVDLSAADTNGDVIVYKFSATGAQDTLVEVKTTS